MRLPEGVAEPRWTDNTPVKALARAFRWKRMLQAGEFTTIAELTGRDRIAASCMARVLCLTVLAHAIVEAILNGKQGLEVTLARGLERFPVERAAQPDHFGRIGSSSRLCLERRTGAPSPNQPDAPPGSCGHTDMGKF